MIALNNDEERIYGAPLTDDDDDEHDSAAHILDVESADQELTFRMPVWLRESSSSFRWTWVPLPLRKAARATAHWIQGPDPPHDLLFQPLFPKFQELPVRFLDRYAPRKAHKATLLLLVYFLWLVPWFVTLVKSNSSGNIEGFGRPQAISCTASYW
jgi:hypothetical protein